MTVSSLADHTDTVTVVLKETADPMKLYPF